MNKQVVIDSNVLVALVDTKDKWHLTGSAILSALEASKVSSIYFDCVLSETFSVLCRRSEEQRRLDQFPVLLNKLTQIAHKEAITWISPEIPRLYDDVVLLIRQHNGALNFHDALIGLFCQELGLRFIVSFDRDFDRIPWLTRIESEADVHRYFSACSNPHS